MDLSMDPYSKIAYWQETAVKERQEKFCIDEYYSRNEKLFSSKSQAESSGQTEFVTESQNFSLRVSDDSNTEDNEVIVITDSSLSSTPECSVGTKQKQTKSVSAKNVDINEMLNLDSSDSDRLEITPINFSSTWKSCIKTDSMHTYQKQIYGKFDHKYNISNDSDSSSSSSSNQFSNKHCGKQKDHSDDILVSPTPDYPKHESCEKGTRKIKTSIVLNSEPLVISSSLDSQSSTSCRNYLNPGKKKHHIGSHNTPVERGKTVKDKFTKRDLRTILANIKSTKAVYESPRQRNNVIIDESLDSSTHPAMSSKDSIIARTDLKNNGMVHETSLDLENEIQGSQIDSFKPQRMPIQITYYEPQEKTAYSELSDRKKKDISHWLRTTPSRYSKSDSSVSNILGTNRSSISSGNSSLDRLEINYETPNNRGKVQRTIHPSPQQRTNVLNNDSVENLTLNRQPTLNTFLQKSMDSSDKILGLQTPNQPTTGYRFKKGDHISRAATDSTKRDSSKEIDVADCADILGKLYGNEWRSKANQLLPTSEPKNFNIKRIDRAVQTERKTKLRHKHYISDSEDEDSNISTRNIKDHQNLIRKGRSQNRTRKDSFINDQLSSSSDIDNTYYTALTQPGVLTNSEQQKPTRVSGVTKRIIAICDSETDDEKLPNLSKENKNTDRKLVYSDVEDNTSTSTSEFDPGDPVPPISIRKKGREKARQVPKYYTNKTTVTSTIYGTQENTFLSSLSGTVPLVNAHPDARKYRSNYKNNREELSNKLYKLYNEKVFDNKLPDNMQIDWNVRMRGTAGFCYNRKSIKHLSGIQKSSRIVLATKILDTPDRLRDTLIHEMCHAAAWLINNVSDGHGPFWREWANKAMRMFPELPPIQRCHDYKIKTKFTYRCTGCAYSIGRHSKSLDVEKKRCGHCYGKFELLINKTTKDGTVQVQTPKRGPSAFALYVKEHYGTLRKQSNKKHAEVMKLLGQQFSAVKIAKKQDNENETYSDTHN